MIANWSRISQFAECRTKAYNWDELRLKSWRDADALTMGGGFHHGAALYLSGKPIQEAIDTCEHYMREQYSTQMVLPEEKPAIEQGIEWSKRAVQKFAEHYAQQDVQVLWPEVKFRVALPNTMHHCWFMHRLLYPDVPFEDCLRLECRIPHYFQGTTDAIVQWMGKVWLFEHKTNKQTLDIFYKKYLLDAQPTGYLYGIWKQLGVLPSGFILNVIQKPYSNARDQLAVGFSREAYFRTTEDLERWEMEFIEQATQYEDAFRRRALGNKAATFMNTKSCTNYNRQCFYMESCQRGFFHEDEFSVRQNDYINNAYYEVAGLPVPEQITNVKEETHGSSDGDGN